MRKETSKVREEESEKRKKGRKKAG